MTSGAGFHWLWPTPVGLHRYANASDVNPLLVRVFGEGRAALQRQRGEEPGPFFASDDDLLHRVKLAEWQDFVGFVVSSLGETAKEANRDAWAGQSFDLRVAIEAMWFQFSRDGAFHDVHTHGNCSWSGVYIVQIDAPAQRVSHPVYGAANDVTRLYGPPFTALGGASSTSPTRTCSRRIRTSSRWSGSCSCFRHGSRTKRCPTAARRTGSSFRSTPASTPPRAIRYTATPHIERRHKRSLNSPGRRSAASLCSLATQSRERMSIPAGKYRLGPEHAKLMVRTGKGGAAAKAGHNLSIHVTSWSAELDVADDLAQSSLTLNADSRSLIVVDGTGGIQALGNDDKVGIAKTIDDEVLKGGTIQFRSTSVTPSPNGGPIVVSGELDLLGRTAPLSFELQAGDDGRIAGTATIKQTDWGIKPYSALFGTLKVLDEVDITVDGRLPPT